MKQVFASLLLGFLVAFMVLGMQPIQSAQSSLHYAITLTPTDRPKPPPEDPDLPKTGWGAPAGMLSPWVEPVTDRFTAPPAGLQPRVMANGFVFIDTSPMVKLEIPALGIRTGVVELNRVDRSWDISELNTAVGWLSDTSWPGYGGNTVLAGHLNLDGYRGGPFLFLSSLHSGDLVHLYTLENRITYKVKQQKLVNPSDRSIYSATGPQKLTLLTCSNWNPNTRTYEKRLLVEAELVGIEGLGFTRRVFIQRMYPYPE